MVSNANRSLTWLAFLLSLPTLAGFASGCNVTLSPKIPSLEKVKVIPQEMGYYFSPEFGSYEFRYQGYKTSGDSGDKEIFAIGEASVELFKPILEAQAT